jgi:hypothetical protein
MSPEIHADHKQPGEAQEISLSLLNLNHHEELVATEQMPAKYLTQIN